MAATRPVRAAAAASKEPGGMTLHAIEKRKLKGSSVPAPSTSPAPSPAPALAPSPAPAPTPSPAKKADGALEIERLMGTQRKANGKLEARPLPSPPILPQKALCTPRFCLV